MTPAGSVAANKKNQLSLLPILLVQLSLFFCVCVEDLLGEGGGDTLCRHLRLTTLAGLILFEAGPNCARNDGDVFDDPWTLTKIELKVISQSLHEKHRWFLPLKREKEESEMDGFKQRS